MSDKPPTPTPPSGPTVPRAGAPATASPAEPRDRAQAPVEIRRMPPPRVTAILAAAMLAVGMAVGAAVGPSPSSSLAGTADLPLLLRTLSALAAAGRAASASPPAQTPTAPPAVKASATPTASSTPATRASAPAQGSSSPSSSAPSSTPSPAPSARRKGGSQKALPAATSVWLIELSGEGFTAAEAQASAAPYITGQAIPSGTLLSSWSTLDAGALASEAALLSGEPPQTLETIVQPPCPEGAAGASCAPGTPGALTAADEFLKQTTATITATAAYRAHGLIVVTFSSIQSATATGLPAGAVSATLSSQPPAGVLVISPFAAAGASSAAAFDPSAPRRSLEGLLHG